MIFLKGENTTRNQNDPEADKEFKSNFKKAMGVEEREYNGVKQDCKQWEGEWIPWYDWRQRLIEKDREEAKRKKMEKRSEDRTNILIGMKNYNPVTYKKQTWIDPKRKKLGCKITEQKVCKVIYK